MKDLKLEGAAFRKSSRSSQSGNCVEVAANLSGIIAMRDTKDRDGGTLIFSSADWEAFNSGVKAGEFDL